MLNLIISSDSTAIHKDKLPSDSEVEIQLDAFGDSLRLRAEAIDKLLPNNQKSTTYALPASQHFEPIALFNQALASSQMVSKSVLRTIHPELPSRYFIYQEGLRTHIRGLRGDPLAVVEGHRICEEFGEWYNRVTIPQLRKKT